jgi:hypothetical protein
VSGEPFTYSLAIGWLRDLASEPTPHDRWPCIRWDDQLLADQIRFLDVQAELGIGHNIAWGFFIDRAWPVPFQNVMDADRAGKLRAFTEAAHERGVKVLHGTGIYSWGFDAVIRQFPEVAAGSNRHAMCPFRPAAWDWQRRVLDFLMEPQWNLDGISMQSADQGRCDCAQCQQLSPAAHHAKILVRSAEYVRANRPDWVIGQASWGLRVDEPGEFTFLQEISHAVDYMVEVRELSASAGRRPEIVRGLDCAFGTLGGVFVEPPQHWERTRWFVPSGLGSARSLVKLAEDGGRACEYFYRLFANPGDEVSWRVGARILSAPQTAPEAALREAVEAVYGVTGTAAQALADWYARAEEAYFSRTTYQVGRGPLSLEPLVWKENPAAPGPPVYLSERMTAEQRTEYARELERLKAELAAMDIPNDATKAKTLACIDGALRDLAALA